jgi:hypothetical protein
MEKAARLCRRFYSRPALLRLAGDHPVFRISAVSAVLLSLQPSLSTAPKSATLSSGSSLNQSQPLADARGTVPSEKIAQVVNPFGRESFDRVELRL